MALSVRFASCLPLALLPRRRNAGTVAFAAASVARRSPYEVLEVGEAASAAEIRAAYRAMAKRAHPDGPAGGREAFLELRLAYETLSDPAARERYDVSAGRIGAARAGRFGASRRRWETDQCW